MAGIAGIAGTSVAACGGPKGPGIADGGDGPAEDTVAPLLIAMKRRRASSQGVHRLPLASPQVDDKSTGARASTLISDTVQTS